jgi:hypothetical protein
MSDEVFDGYESEADYFDDLEIVEEDPGLLNKETYEALQRINEHHADEAKGKNPDRTGKCQCCGSPTEEDDPDEKNDKGYLYLEKIMELKMQLETLTDKVRRVTEYLGIWD